MEFKDKITEPNNQITEQIAITNVLVQKIATLEYENAAWQVKYTGVINELEKLRKESSKGNENEKLRKESSKGNENEKAV